MGRHSEGAKRRHWLRWTLLGLLVVIVLLAIDLALAGSRAASAFKDGRDALTTGGSALESGNVPEAQNEFGAASSAGQDATDALGHPSVSVVGWLPWFSDDVDALRRAARAINLAAEGGTSSADAADAAGWDGSSIPGFQSGGQFNPSALAAAAPHLQDAADHLSAASDEMAPVDPSSLAAPLQGPVEQAKQEIDTRASQAEIAAKLAELVPVLFGADGPRTYLLVTLSPSDPRAAGGYPGVFGVLHADGHQISLSGLAPTSTIPGVAAVDGPKDAKRAWHWAGIDRFFWDTTYTADFPTAAGFMKRIWEAGGGKPVDGVIAGDPTLMSAILGAVGSVDTPAWPETITADNVQQIVGADVYRTEDSHQSDEWEVGVGDALWQAFLTRPLSTQSFATALSSASADGHLQVWTSDASEEAQLDSLGVSGRFALPSDGSALVRLNGFTDNRAGYFAKTSVKQSSAPAPEAGSTKRTVTVRVENTAPSNGPKSILLGIHPGDTGGKPIGTFGTDINVYLPADATKIHVKQDGSSTLPFEWNELGAHVVSLSRLIPPGTMSEMQVSYELGPEQRVT